MRKNERKFSNFIDRLNAEKKPADMDSPELIELAEVVKSVRRLKSPAMPGDDFPKRIVSTVRNDKRSNKPWYAAAAAAVAIVVITSLMYSPFGTKNIVNAMDKAFQEVKAYHAIIEITEINAQGEETLQSKREVWADRKGHYYIKELGGSYKGQITANNGEKKWQLIPDRKQAIIFPAFPDPYRFTFELSSELKNVKDAEKIKVIGDENISERLCTVLKISPKGGFPYKIWVDKETDLPLQKQTAMQNALQYRVTYTKVEFAENLPSDLTQYNLPDGFSEIDSEPEQLVNNIEEAEHIAGFLVRHLKDIPSGYTNKSLSVELNTKKVKFYFASSAITVVIMQEKAKDEFKPSYSAVLATVDGCAAEILSPAEMQIGSLSNFDTANTNSIRWQKDSFEYTIIGDTSIEDLNLFIVSLTGKPIQISNEIKEFTPQLNVEFDINAEENDQKSVDSGNSPWKLDPAYVTQVFASLKLYPNGISGEYPINYDEIKIIKNTGSLAIAEVNSKISPVSKVYLKKLIRQDQSGIWTVVGYDKKQR